MLNTKRTLLMALSGCTIFVMVFTLSTLRYDQSSEIENQELVNLPLESLDHKGVRTIIGEHIEQASQATRTPTQGNTGAATNSSYRHVEKEELTEKELALLIESMPVNVKEQIKDQHKLDQRIKSVSERVDAIEEGLSKDDVLALFKDIDLLDQQNVFLSGEANGLKTYIVEKSGVGNSTFIATASNSSSGSSLTERMEPIPPSNLQQKVTELTTEMMNQDFPLAEIKIALNKLYQDQLTTGSSNEIR